MNRALFPTDDIGIAAAQRASDASWLALRRLLWSDTPAKEHAREMAESLARGDCVLLEFDDSGVAVGLAEATKRHDYVNGTATSPVSFVEGVYVRESHRRRGIARALISGVASWAVEQGCSELASDALIQNLVSHAVFRALGFEETERVVYFRRLLPESRP